ncbi:MAG: small, acid-soluble spore protein, alpha/beta type [Solirubrobacterales bacterium]
MSDNNSSNQPVVTEAKQGLNNFKMEVANELGLHDYANVDKGNLTSRQNGSVGGTMTKKMVEAYERGLV